MSLAVQGGRVCFEQFTLDAATEVLYLTTRHAYMYVNTVTRSNEKHPTLTVEPPRHRSRRRTCRGTWSQAHASPTCIPDMQREARCAYCRNHWSQKG